MSNPEFSSYQQHIQHILEMNEVLKKGSFGLLQPIVEIITTIDSLLSKTRAISGRIQRFTSDNMLSLDEATELVDTLQDHLSEITPILDAHEANKEYLNRLIILSSNFGDLLEEVIYLTRIERGFGDTYSGVEARGYYIDSDTKNRIYQELDALIDFSSPANNGVPVEQELVALLTYLATISPLITENVMYATRSQMLEELDRLIDNFRSSLRSLIRFYKESMFEHEIREAILGLTTILEHSDMKDKQKVKLSGLIMKVDGYGELKKLKDDIQRLK